MPVGKPTIYNPHTPLEASLQQFFPPKIIRMIYLQISIHKEISYK